MSIMKMLRPITFACRKTGLNYFKTKCFRNVHKSATLTAKIYLENENRYAFNLMENKGFVVGWNHKKSVQTITKEHFENILMENWFQNSPQKHFETFLLLSNYCSNNRICISNQMFDNFIDGLTDNIKWASDVELKELFYCLAQWPETESVRTRNFIEVWAALDDECINRMKNWSFDELLMYMSLFYLLNVVKLSEFTNKCLQKFATKAKRLSKSQVVQAMFYIGIMRKPPFDMHNLEVCIENMFSEFSIDELAIISMGFFKSKTPIRSMLLVSKIIDKTTSDSKNVHEVSLAALLKVIRYSMKIDDYGYIFQMLDILQHEIERLSVMCNVHLALVGTSTLTLHKYCLNRIASAVVKSITETRLKDLERLVLTFGLFDLKFGSEDCFYLRVISELRKPERVPEIEKYGRSFACCIAYLGMVDLYPSDLMCKALSPQFLLRTYGKHIYSYGREILTINNLAQIFCKDSKMNMLTDNMATVLAKKYTDYVPQENYSKQYNITEKMFLDIYRILKEYRGGDDFVIGEHILTHHQRGDLVLCNDKNGSPLEVKNIKTSPFGLIRYPPDDNTWIALVVAGRNAMIKSSNNPTGNFTTKIKELNAIGFRSALVPWSIYSTLITRDEKIKYLNHIIQEATLK